MVRYVLRPSYAQTETLRAALDSIRSPAGNVQVAGNILIITDYATQVRDMMSLAKTIDVPGNNDGIYTIPVKYADATQLAQKLNEILGVTAGGARPAARPRRRAVAAGAAAAAGRARRRQSSDEVSRRRAVEDPRRRSHEHADRRVERGRLPARRRRSSIASTSCSTPRAAPRSASTRSRTRSPKELAHDAQQRAAGPASSSRAGGQRGPGAPARRCAGAAPTGGRRPRRLARGPGPRHQRQADELADRDVERPRLPRDQGRHPPPRPAAPPDLHRGADPRGPAQQGARHRHVARTAACRSTAATRSCSAACRRANARSRSTRRRSRR